MNWRSVGTRRTNVQSEADQWRPHVNGFQTAGVCVCCLMTAVVVGCREVGDLDRDLALVKLLVPFLPNRTVDIMHIHRVGRPNDKSTDNSCSSTTQCHASEQKIIKSSSRVRLGRNLIATSLWLMAAFCFAVERFSSYLTSDVRKFFVSPASEREIPKIWQFTGRTTYTISMPQHITLWNFLSNGPQFFPKLWRNSSAWGRVAETNSNLTRRTMTRTRLRMDDYFRKFVLQ